MDRGYRILSRILGVVADMTDISKEAVEETVRELMLDKACGDEVVDTLRALSARITELEAQLQTERVAKWRLIESPLQHRVVELEAERDAARDDALQEAASAVFIPKYTTDTDMTRVKALLGYRDAILSLRTQETT